MASGWATQLHTCFAFGVCSPVTFLWKFTCLASLGLRESLQEVASIAAWPGLEGKMSQICVSGSVTTSVSAVKLCSTARSFGISGSGEGVSQEKNKLSLNILALTVLTFARHGKEKM